MPAPPFSEKFPNLLQNQYEQICFPFAPNIMQTFVFMLPLCTGCSLLIGGNQVITCPWGSEEILLKPHMLCPTIQCTAVIINPVQLLSSNEPCPGTCHHCASASSHWCIAATTCHTQLAPPLNMVWQAQPCLFITCISPSLIPWPPWHAVLSHCCSLKTGLVEQCKFC